MKVISRWILGCMLLVVFFLTSIRWVEAGSRAATPLAKEWATECVVCPRTFAGVMDHAIQWDAAGHPHLAYGRDHLYHAWHDGTRWQSEVVDTALNVGEIAALVLDSQGRAHISYLDATANSIKYARWNGATWDIQQSIALPQSMPMRDLALLLDAGDRPHIAYSAGDSYSTRFSYVYQNETGWMEELVGTGGRFNTSGLSLGVDAAGRPHLSYSTPGALVHAVRGNGGWEQHALETGAQPSNQSLALDAQGRVHLSYVVSNYTQSMVELRYSIWDGSGWTHQTVETNSQQPATVGSTSLVLDASGHPHIGYYDPNNQGLDYATFDGSAWSYRSVVQGTNSLDTASLALDGAGVPLIVYHDVIKSTLNAARWDGATWSVEVLDQSDWVLDSMVALDGAGRPHIAYLEGGDELIYASFDGQHWVQQPVDDRVWAGASLVLDAQGRPHMSYRKSDSESGESSLIYAYFDGSQWQRQRVDTVGCYDRRGGALALDSTGRPHIAYCTMETLRYASFDGATWNTQSIAEAGVVSGNVSLRLDRAGRPHISYHPFQDSSPFRPGYTHWDGTRWIVHNLAEVASTDGSIPSLALDGNDFPHIAYGGSYARWDGSQWLIQQVTTAGLERRILSPSLALDGQGQPHIAYAGGQYAHWDGQQWLLESIGSFDSNVALVLDGAGQPHLSYQEMGDLKYTHLQESVIIDAPFRLYMPVTIR